MAFSALTTGEVDADSPITTALMTKIKDNFDAIDGGSYVDQGVIAADSVGQSEIKTDFEDDSDSGIGASSFVLSGGFYTLGVGWQDDAGVARPGIGGIGLNGVSIDLSDSTYISYITLDANNATDTLYSRVYHIDASPPYNLGDGEIPLFVWVKMDGNKVVGIQSSGTPPWAYNGPTDIKADKVIRNKKGAIEKYKFIRSIDEESGEITREEKLIDQEMKNKDMALIPHPFASLKPSESVILLDPVSTEYLQELRLAGENINKLIHNDYLRLDNTTIQRAAPSGVTPSAYKWKNTRKRAGEAVANRKRKK